MKASALPRGQRALLAGVGMVVLYGVAALLWFTGREDAWTKSRKGYEKARRQLAAENKLISERASWQERLETESRKMPIAEEGESTQSRWQRVLEKIAADHNVAISGEQPGEEEQHGDVWELPIVVRYKASLGSLVQFLYALNTAEDAMLDIRDLDIAGKGGSGKNDGWLSGSFTLTCAYVKEGAAAK